MDDQDVYTITIVRNIGIPISFTIKRWKVVFLFVMVLLFFSLLIAGSVDYLFLKIESGELVNQLTKTQEKAGILSEQISQLDHDRYWGNSVEKSKEIASSRDEIVAQPEFSTEGIWVTSKPTFTEEEIQEGRFVEIETFKASVNGDLLKLAVKIKNTSNPPQVVGGYICVTLVNTDQSPVGYQPVTGGELGDNGFPSSYKSGKAYYIKRRSSTKQLKFSLTEVNEYYTNAMIFLFSYQGRLLNKSQYDLKKEIFLE
jgi:hypothetical protein